MATREEIREGIAKRLLYHTNDNEMLSEMIADNLLFYLHSQGVVIKVDTIPCGVTMGRLDKHKAFEPLIKEG